jgi:GT2 family glycosyltransferase
MINVSIVLYQTPIDEVNNIVEVCSLSDVVKNIYVIDNSPTTDLEKKIISSGKLSYIHNPSNPGYGGGHNIAMKKSVADSVDYHLVLNADVIFQSSMLSKMLTFALSNPKIGLLSPRMYNEDKSIQYSCKLLPTPLNMFVRAFLPKCLRFSIDARYQLEHMDHNRPIEVSYVSGAFMFLNCDILRKVGMYDVRFFMYPEDIDLSRRFSAVSIVLFVPQFEIIHKYGGATRKSLRVFIIHICNMVRYFNKWGWMFDSERRCMNKRTQEQFAIKKIV